MRMNRSKDVKIQARCL